MQASWVRQHADGMLCHIGNVAEALVEFAPFQRVPRHCKPDPKQGTIHDGASQTSPCSSVTGQLTLIHLYYCLSSLDPEFKAFLEDPSAVIHNEAPADHLSELVASHLPMLSMV